MLESFWFGIFWFVFGAGLATLAIAAGVMLYRMLAGALPIVRFLYVFFRDDVANGL